MRSNSQTSGGLCHDPEHLCLEHCAHLHPDAGETLLLRLPVPAGHGLRVWSTARLDFSVPPGGVAKLHFGAFGGSIPGLVQQSAHSGPVQHADQGLSLRGRVGLRDGPAPHGLGHAGRAHRTGQRGLRPAAVQRCELH